MAYKQPRVPQMREGARLTEVIRELILFLKDFCMETWVNVTRLQKAAGADDTSVASVNGIEPDDAGNVQLGEVDGAYKLYPSGKAHYTRAFDNETNLGIQVGTGSGYAFNITLDKSESAKLRYWLQAAGGTGYFYTTHNKPTLSEISFLGTTPIASVEDDTPANWRALGAGYCRYNKAGLLNNQPSTYGFLINYVHNDTGDVFQLWKSLASGAVYNRGGNANGWYDGGFKKMYDTGNLLDATYPVGSIYMSANSTSPASLFGGTWERIYGRFLIGQNSTDYPAGSTGGAATVTLTQNQMPAHRHTIIRPRWYRSDVNTENSSTGTIYGTESSTTASYYSTDKDMQTTGGGAAHNNMPPWLSVYMWKRVS